MNVKKPVDYSAMYTALDKLVAENLPQMELYCEIGWLVSGRPEKGAAVAAAEYLNIHIGLTQQDTRCSDSTNKAREKLMGMMPAVEAETKFVEIRLESGAAAMISA